ncbi:hypothetical protein [Kribbella voronezhensis]|uniref:hypothetical protein n=1 Tax=Kribbella voronezhensis TaxID=2512212 RepID=UPI001416FF19|nr:hypothetical protein [Kribbella voronezhensis]
MSVAAATVAAVVLGGTVASRRVPHSESVAAAAPLPPSTGVPATTGPTRITLALRGLGKGQPPTIPYLVGREVRGGAGGPVRIPGTEDVLEIARVNSSVLALTTNDNGWHLQRLNANGAKSITGVNHLEVNEDRSGAAYAAYDGGLPPVEGGTVYADSGTSLKSLKLKTGWNFKVLAYAAGKVYYQSSDVLGSGATWSTYAWTPGSTKAELVKTIPYLTKLSSDGKTAASTLLVNNSGSCSAINVVSSGVRVWKTCDYSLNGFSPGGAMVFGVPSRDQGSCASAEAVLDTRTGRLLREWKACVQNAAPEDYEHLLLVVSASGASGNNTQYGIVRCAISTGDCELATPLAAERLLLSA